MAAGERPGAAGERTERPGTARVGTDRSDTSADAPAQSEVDVEQGAVDSCYARLDSLRQRVAAQLRSVRRTRVGGSPQNRSERDAFAREYERREKQLWAVEERLVFGRLDLRDGQVRRIGRLGLSDDRQQQLLVDWRAAAAEDFYRATALSPGEVVRRRHIGMRGRTVVGVEDEVLDLDAAAHPDRGDRSLVLTGEGALMAALAEHRTGRMRDIVATIQAEQDQIVRAPLEGVLVVQGGPGTGKTAVALHRAAYLLFRHRERLERAGVLVLGPNPRFLRYIEQVLPSLGETAVVLSTVAELVPGVSATGTESAETARVKGDQRMVDVLRRAVRNRQRVPEGQRLLRVGAVSIVLEPRVVASARDRARHSGRPHNAARHIFAKAVLDDLVQRLAALQGVDADADHRPALLAELHDSPDVRREVNLCWMPLEPAAVLRRLLSDPDELAAAARSLRPAERRLLVRREAAPWTAADVPLLDELAELIGEDDAGARAAARAAAQARAEELRYAEGVLATGLGGGLVSAEALAARFAPAAEESTVVDRATVDRTWTYGHVVVDEAQELSSMAWRAVLRRVPSRSMTVVGDTAQTSALAGSASWANAFRQLRDEQWRVCELTVNYRTPAPVMEVAAALLVEAGIDAHPPRAARTGLPPTLVGVPQVDVTAVERVVAGELEVLGGGTLAVIFPAAGYEQLRHQLRDRWSATAAAAGGDEALVLLDVREAKGLEFDTVVVVEPADVIDQSQRGVRDLYVALTRCTQRLVVVHARPLPAAVAADKGRAMR